jgi:hypothetical protein
MVEYNLPLPPIVCVVGQQVEEDHRRDSKSYLEEGVCTYCTMWMLLHH